MTKRAFDLAVSLIAGVVTAPIWLLAGVFIKLDSPGAILHRATRVGKDGRFFTLFKFRTMIDGAASKGPGITTAHDPRVTRVGRVLRKSKLDELPQLINVVRGEMSIVGPRPEDPRYVETYSPEQRRVLSVRPGLVSPAAIAFRHEENILAVADDPDTTYRNEILPAKLQLDLAYLDEHSIRGDLSIMIKAGRAILRRHRMGEVVSPASSMTALSESPHDVRVGDPELEQARRARRLDED